jgi:hypothetical protein
VSVTEQGPNVSWFSWMVRSAYESGRPRNRRDVLEAAVLLTPSVALRIFVPLHDWLLRAIVAYLVAASATLLIGYLVHYIGLRLRRRRKVAA